MANKIQDTFFPLPPMAVQFKGGLDDVMRQSLENWNKRAVPYGDFVEMFRSGRKQFALGEMWGKAVRSGAMFYRYTHDPDLRDMLRRTVADLLTTKRENGSISCTPPELQPEGAMGDLWERKYVLLGLDGYYEHVEADPAVLQAMIDELDCTIEQVGPPPKVRIVDLGWSDNRIESSTILEPTMRLYARTGNPRYLEFAKYIVEEEGGGKDFNIIGQALANTDPAKIGGTYPKAYEMMSLFEGLVEYFRVTGDERWKRAVMNLFAKVRDLEITITGNGGGDQPYHPKVAGEGWDYTALEQTNPKMDRTMETCTGVTWLKLCSQINRLTGDPSAIDMIERYVYNGLIGAMKPSGDGFSYVNRLNGSKTTNHGWGFNFNGLPVTCCNLNGPMGLAYLPFVAVLDSADGPVINLFNSGTATMKTPSGKGLVIDVGSDFPKGGSVAIQVAPEVAEEFCVRVRNPGWNIGGAVFVNGREFPCVPGRYAEIRREWKKGDEIQLRLDMRCRLLDAPHGSNRDGDFFKAVVCGPIALSRDGNTDPACDAPVTILADGGYVDARRVTPTLDGTKMEFEVPTRTGTIRMIDYASVNNWNGARICTWLPMERDAGNDLKKQGE